MGEYKRENVNIYPGSGLFPNNLDYSQNINSYVSASRFGFTSDHRTINQLKAVSDKLATGTKLVEVQGVDAKILEAIPKQQFKEISRLKQLTGVEFTFHGPIVEPSGFGQGGYTQDNQKGAELQMINAIQRAHDLEPNGNIVVTFHSSAVQFPELKTKLKQGKEEKSTELLVYDRIEGKATRIKPKYDPIQKKELSIEEQLKVENKEQWDNQLSQLVYHSEQGVQRFEILSKQNLQTIEFADGEQQKIKPLEIYHLSKTEKGKEFFSSLAEPSKEAFQNIVRDVEDNISYGRRYALQAYDELKNVFGKAWQHAESAKNKEEMKLLEDYRIKLLKETEKLDTKNIEDVAKLSRIVRDGLNILDNMSSPPESFTPFSNFFLEKSGETFGNVAFKGFEEFKNSAPIISIENPPAGNVLSRAEDLKSLVANAREHFAKRAVNELSMSESEAKKQAEKLIGVTWDVGHINMIRKFGYDDSDLKKETEIIAKDVKHIHLSDNFGYEHTELPMGMGNVPMKEHLEALKKYNNQLDKLKQVVETGGPWFEHFKKTPFTETLKAFNSPIYGMDMSPSWNSSSGASGAYFSGYGQMLPEQHFNMYGAGFSTLPRELGGQMSGKSRISGDAID